MPKFYITLPTVAVAQSKDTAQIMVKIDLSKTKKFNTRQKLVEYLQGELDSKISGGTATVKLLEQAQPIDEACLNAVSQRFRPIILSSTATITGLIPLAFSKSALFGPMSVTIMFGLGSATFLTFVVVPVVYSLVNTKLEEKPNIKSRIDKLNFKSLMFWKRYRR